MRLSHKIIGSVASILLFVVFLYAANVIHIGDKWFDVLLSFNHKATKSDKVVIIAVDDLTVKKYSDPSFWTRSRYESLLYDLEKQKPSAVVFDYYFNTKSIPENVDWELIGKTAGIDSGKVDEIYGEYDSAINDPNFLSSIDRDFVLSVRKGGNVFFPTLLALNKDYSYKGIKLSSFDLLSRYSKSGYVNAILDKDGTIRKMPNIKRAPLKHLSQNVVEFVTKKQIDLSADRAEFIMFPSGQGEGFDIIPFEFAYNGIFETRKGDKVSLKDKIVLIGDYGELFGDYYRVPIGKSAYMPGVEVLASEMDTLITGSKITDIGMQNRLIYSSVLFVLFLVAFLFLHGFYAIAFLIFGNLALIYLDIALFQDRLYMSYPLFAFALIAPFLGIFLTRLYFSFKDKARLRRFFSKFVGKNIVELLIKRPDLNLDGEKKEITVFFADLKDFTALSEKMQPESVVKLLDKVFLEANNIIFKNNGTLDKYIGDCIMAFWGAPLADDKHAQKACLVALELANAFKDTQSNIDEIDVSSLKFRIGISTGIATVGSVGTDDFADYTVIGDKVNLASRLESINKAYNSSIIITSNTKDSLSDSFACRELDTIKVKGREESVVIYELLDFEGRYHDNAILQKIISNHSKGLNSYRKGKLLEAKKYFKLNKELGDEVADAFIDRINSMDVRKDWDGVWEFQDK